MLVMKEQESSLGKRALATLQLKWHRPVFFIPHKKACKLSNDFFTLELGYSAHPAIMLNSKMLRRIRTSNVKGFTNNMHVYIYDYISYMISTSMAWPCHNFQCENRRATHTSTDGISASSSYPAVPSDFLSSGVPKTNHFHWIDIC